MLRTLAHVSAPGMKIASFTLLTSRTELMNRDLHISELATCAVRYALGRQTYVSFSVPQAIKSHMNLISTKALYVMSRDIREYKEREGLIGMPCDHRSWMDFLDALTKEINERTNAKSTEETNEEVQPEEAPHWLPRHARHLGE